MSQAERKKVSAYVLTYNEEAKIRDCLESITWADEIIVLDSFSTDKTVDICREYQCRIIQKKFSGFGSLRNFAVDQATHEWILSVDADERVTRELRDEILNKLSTGPDADVFFVPRINYFLGRRVRHCGWYPDYRQPQFFRKGKMAYNDQQVHEGFSATGTISYLRNHCLQFPFLDLAQFYRKMDRYSTLRAGDMMKEGKQAGILNMIVNPTGMFLKMFILKQGFLDGRIGLILSMLYAHYTFVKYVKLWEMWQNMSSRT